MKRVWPLVLMMLLTGCTAAGRSGGVAPGDLPTLAAVRPPEPEGADMPRNPDLPAPNADATVELLELPVDASLDAAWARLEADAFPAPARAAWEANGFRVALASPAQMQKAAEALPPTLDRRATRVLATTHPVPVRRTPTLSGAQAVAVDLTIPPHAPRVRDVSRGRLQLLMSTHPAGGGVAVELVPHQYLPRPSLLPRGPLEKELDGEVFEPLTLRAVLGPGQTLVVGRYRPAPPSDPLAAAASERPPSPGDVLLTGQVGPDATQQLLLIRARPL